MASASCDSPVGSAASTKVWRWMKEAVAFASPPDSQTFDGSMQQSEERPSAFKTAPMYRTESLAVELALEKDILFQEKELTVNDSPFPVFIGYDTHEDIAFEVAKFSMERRSSIPLDIQRINELDLKKRGVCTREHDPKQSTQFTYARFYLPYLQNYKGWAYFCDDDFLWLGDIKGMVDLIEDKYAIMCVKHDYRPTETSKLRGCEQAIYPRKNWSSSFLINCGHPANRACTLELLNNAPPGGFLHRFSWIEDDELIGELPLRWNFLVGWHDKLPPSILPGAIHYTLGGPWYPDYRNKSGPLTDYHEEWLLELREYEATLPCPRLLCPHELYSEEGNAPMKGYPNSNAAYEEDGHWQWYGGTLFGAGTALKLMKEENNRLSADPSLLKEIGICRGATPNPNDTTLLVPDSQCM